MRRARQAGFTGVVWRRWRGLSSRATLAVGSVVDHLRSARPLPRRPWSSPHRRMRISFGAGAVPAVGCRASVPMATSSRALMFLGDVCAMCSTNAMRVPSRRHFIFLTACRSTLISASLAHRPAKPWRAAAYSLPVPVAAEQRRLDRPASEVAMPSRSESAARNDRPYIASSIIDGPSFFAHSYRYYFSITQQRGYGVDGSITPYARGHVPPPRKQKQHGPLRPTSIDEGITYRWLAVRKVMNVPDAGMARPHEADFGPDRIRYGRCQESVVDTNIIVAGAPVYPESHLRASSSPRSACLSGFL